MALFTRLKTLCVFESALKFNLVSKSAFHSLSRAPARCPPPGTRSFFKLFKKPTQSDLKKADDIPDSFEMIYRNTMNRYILVAQIVSLVTGGLMIITFLMKSDYKPHRRRSLEWSETSRPRENEEFYYITIFIVFIVLLQTMVARTPIRIYKVPGTSKYISINYGSYFFGKERFTFHRGEITRSRGMDILPWKENKFMIEKVNDRRSIILLDYFFRRPADLGIMLGEQPDPDLGEELKENQH